MLLTLPNDIRERNMQSTGTAVQTYDPHRFRLIFETQADVGFNFHINILSMPYGASC